MKYAQNVPVKIVMLGAGGTGGHAAPHIYRILNTLDRQVRFIICDGDIVEQKNLVRQNFIHSDLGKNKAQVLAERYASAFGLEAEYVPEYIENEQKLRELVSPGRYRKSYNEWADSHVILIGAVDNNKSRQLCNRVFSTARNLIYIDSGNGEHSGQVVCGLKRGGRKYFKPAAEVYPDILDNEDKYPSELSCAEAAVSAPQSIAANLMAATMITCMVYNIVIGGSIEVRDLYFNTEKIMARSTINKRTLKGKTA